MPVQAHPFERGPSGGRGARPHGDAHELVLRFGYGAIVPWVTRLGDGALRRSRRTGHGGAAHARRSHRPEPADRRRISASSAGETVPFVLTYSPSHVPPPAPLDPQAELKRPERFWTRLVEAMPAGRTLLGRRRALADHSQGAHLCADRRHHRGPDHLAAGAAGRHAETGTIASAGCATRPSPCSR